MSRELAGRHAAATALCHCALASTRGTGDEVALNIEIIVDSGMDAEKALGGSC